jgi:hypothetical protein
MRHRFLPVRLVLSVLLTASSLTAQTNYLINSGGTAASPFAADQKFSGGSNTFVSTATITGIGSYPMSIYQTERSGDFTYTLDGFPANAPCELRLHFAETFWDLPGQRIFSVDLNGESILSGYDIVAKAGGNNKAIIETFLAYSNASGQLILDFIPEVDNAKVSGITIRQLPAVVDTDEDAIRQIQTYLSYFPDNASMAPPRLEQYDEDPLARQLDTLVPESRAKVYDIRTVLRAIADRDSVFPLKERFAKVAVTSLARIRGRSVGFIATNPMFKGGALDPDACDKITNFIVLCDSFNIPIIFLADTPGFLVGAESEKRRLPGKIMNFMAALELSTVPKIALVLRKSYGQAYLNMGGGKSDVTATWFSGEISFMDPAVAVNVVHGIKPGEQPERYHQLVQEVSKGTTAYELAAPFMAQMVIDPNDTRDFLADMLEVLSRRMTNGVGQHRLADWPPAF